MWLCDLDEVKSLNLGETYRNRTSAIELMHYISKESFDHVTKCISHGYFFCIMGNESTDISSQEQTMWFVYTCVTTVHFMGSRGLPRADSKTIYNAIRDIAEKTLDIECEKCVQKLVASSIDGASVMLGNKTGLAARVREVEPHIMILHCMAHRKLLPWAMTQEAYSIAYVAI